MSDVEGTERSDVSRVPKPGWESLPIIRGEGHKDIELLLEAWYLFHGGLRPCTKTQYPNKCRKSTPQPTLSTWINSKEWIDHQTGATMMLDLRHGLRSLARSPVLTGTIVLTVGLGVGATTAMFAVIHAVILSPLPYADPTRLVRIYTDAPPNRFRFSVADYLALEDQQTRFRSRWALPIR
jgi:hypothetical protein